MRAIETALTLIMILLIFGVVLTATENSTDKVVRATETNNMEKIVCEVVDNLINNPGTPDNWNEYGKGTPGLAVVNDEGNIVPNSVSYSKLIALGNDYEKLVYERMLMSKIHSSMELTPKESSISSVKIGDIESDANMFSLTRLVKCDFYRSYVIKDFESDGKCNKNHDQTKYCCNYFKLFKGNLRDSDYYLLIDDSEIYDVSYIIETTSDDEVESWKTAISNKVLLNDKIDFNVDMSAIVFVHLDKPHPKAVIASVPKNFDEDLLQYDYFRTNECEFVIKAWH